MKNGLKELNDQQLIHLFVEGEDAAITELIYRYKDAVYTSIIYLVREKYLAEDLFQDTFIKIIKNLKSGKYAEQGKFLPWAVRIAHNLCIDYFRKVKQNVRVVTQDGLDLFEVLSIDEDTADKNITQLQTTEQVQHIVNMLPQEQREVVVLRMYASLSFKDIAKITGVSINTSLGRMRYALLNMKRIIEEHNLVLR